MTATISEVHYAREAGKRARMANKPRTVPNEYNDGGDLSRAWVAGWDWLDAELDAAAKVAAAGTPQPVSAPQPASGSDQFNIGIPLASPATLRKRLDVDVRRDPALPFGRVNAWGTGYEVALRLTLARPHGVRYNQKLADDYYVQGDISPAEARRLAALLLAAANICDGLGATLPTLQPLPLETLP